MKTFKFFIIKLLLKKINDEMNEFVDFDGYQDRRKQTKENLLKTTKNINKNSTLSSFFYNSTTNLIKDLRFEMFISY